VLVRRRISVLVALLIGGAALLLGRLAQLQVVAPEKYVTYGQDQRLRNGTINGVRGAITDRNGEELVISVELPTVWTDPLLVEDAAATATALAPVLGMSTRELTDLLDGPGRFAYLARTVEPDVGDRVAALDLPGVFLESEPTRLRPGGDVAVTVLGQVSTDQEGISGLERQHDSLLAGSPGTLITEVGSRGESIPQGMHELIPAEDGAGLEISLDRALQFEVEQSLVAHLDTVCADAGTVVMMEPATGEILAMATVVRDDDGTAVVTSENRAITSVYEPASVMKPLTFAGLLDQGRIRTDTSLNVPGSIRIYDDDFIDEPEHEPQIMTTAQILAQSSNVGTILWADQLGAESLDSYLRRFGFGSPTNIGFPDESAGLFPQLEDWTGTSLATIALGQGIAVTPLQVLTAYNTIANGGTHVEPRLVRARVEPDGERHEDPAAPVERVISEEASEELTGMLVGVVANGGTAFRAAVPGYSVAAKTGTARKVQADGGYKDELGNFRYIATVAGFFPASNPKLSMIVVLDEPGCGEYFASRVAAPLFGQLAGWALRHYEIAPDMSVDDTAIATAEEVASGEDAAADGAGAEGQGG
jgi:cell division protein FtsI (penicillin-binding protein 3)